MSIVLKVLHWAKTPSAEVTLVKSHFGTSNKEEQLRNK